MTAADTIDLYVWRTDGAEAERACGPCLSILSDEERNRAARFVADRDRRTFVLAHAMLRQALSDAVRDVAPSAWDFAAGPHGRPAIAGPRRAGNLHFNLSHTDGCVACVVSHHSQVGVDVERVAPHRADMDTAREVFSGAEVAALQSLSGDAFTSRFFDLWTLKEAYVKARGAGLHLPLRQFTVAIAPGVIAVAFAAAMNDDPARWRLTLMSPSPDHRLAVADGSGVAGGLTIRAHAFHHSWRETGP